MEMVLVCGPLPPLKALQQLLKMSVCGVTCRICKNIFAAADFGLVEGGLTSAVELAAVGTPFVYVPLSGHVEQESEVAPRLER